MIDLLKVLAPLIVELLLSITTAKRERKEERKALREEILEAVRGGDVHRVNALVNRLRAKRTLRNAAARKRVRDQEAGSGPDFYA